MVEAPEFCHKKKEQKLKAAYTFKRGVQGSALRDKEQLLQQIEATISGGLGGLGRVHRVLLWTRGVKIAAVEGGADCSGDASEEMSCNVRACPVDCVPSDWSSWEPCTTSCGNGTQVRRRFAEVQATGGGLDCDNNFLEEQSCYEGACPVSCVWGDWGSWSSCSASCGSSDSYVSSIRERDVVESAGGLPCQGDATRRKRCGFDECPVD
ncbi:HMCN1, partial [Symbiodinium sp. CCMP2456]